MPVPLKLQEKPKSTSGRKVHWASCPGCPRRDLGVTDTSLVTCKTCLQAIAWEAGRGERERQAEEYKRKFRAEINAEVERRRAEMAGSYVCLWCQSSIPPVDGGWECSGVIINRAPMRYLCPGCGARKAQCDDEDRRAGAVRGLVEVRYGRLEAPEGGWKDGGHGYAYRTSLPLKPGDYVTVPGTWSSSPQVATVVSTYSNYGGGTAMICGYATD
jgi:hypothetical protein